MQHQQKPELLVDPAWLEARLDDPKVRVFDCTLTRIPQPDGASLWESGRAAWEISHIPGAFYLHMVEDLSAPAGTIPYGMPSSEAVGEVLSSFGVADDATIVLYGDSTQSVVHRIWWVLTASGVPDVHILDGGWQRWRAEGLPIESGAPALLATSERSSLRSRPDMKIDRAEVSGALGDPATSLIHALSSEQFCGTGGQVYRRPGRIPGSVNVPAQTLLDPDTLRFHSVEDLRAIFTAVGADRATTIVPYCGGGIAASTVFLALTIAGYDNVRLYDGSLLDWTADPAAPMVTGTDASANSGR